MGTRKGVVWVILGLALGLGGAAFLGVLVFWGLPRLQRAQSPLAEARSDQIMLRCLGESPIAPNRETLAKEADATWQAILATLGIAQEEIPWPVYVYLYSEPGELPIAFAAREAEEGTPLAVVDHLHGRPLAGALARLACSLCFGPPGNMLFPRGLALYFDAPEHPWAMEAAAWDAAGSWQLLWERGERLLPADPWEAVYFKANAPWTSASSSLEIQRALIQAAQDGGGKARQWEAIAGAWAKWVLENFGRRGVEAFWRVRSWIAAAKALELEPQDLAMAWEQHLTQALKASPQAPHFLALRDLYAGKTSQALEALEDRGISWGLAFLACGEPDRAWETLQGVPEGEPLLSVLNELCGQPKLVYGRLSLVGKADEEAERWLTCAEETLARALDFWELTEENLPEHMVFYLVEEEPQATVPWGIVWVTEGVATLPEEAVRLVLEGTSPGLLPSYRTFLEGVVRYLAHPNRDFRGEAGRLLSKGHWVSLSQPLFGVYPLEVAQAEAGAFVQFLVDRYGIQGVRTMWRALLEGASPFRAAEVALGTGLTQLEEELKDWLRRP